MSDTTRATRTSSAIIPTLDCQDCGVALLDLSPEQAQRVAENPYAYVVYCVRCGQDREREQNGREVQ